MTWDGVPGLGPVTTDGSVSVGSGNLAVGSGMTFAGGVGVVGLMNVVTPPTSAAGLLGGVLYVQSGSLRYLGALGTVTIVGSA